MAVFVESKKPSTHQVIRSGGLLKLEGHCDPVLTGDDLRKHADANLPDGGAESEGITAHALGDYRAFLLIPLGGMRGKRKQEVRVSPHCLQAGFTAEELPDHFRLDLHLPALWLQVVARYRVKTGKVNRLQRCDERFEAAAVQVES